MALFLQGAGGDMIDVQFKDFNRPRGITPMGTMLALSTLTAWRNIQTGDAKLNIISETISLPRRTDIPGRIETLETLRMELTESLAGMALNFKSFLPLYLRYALSPDYPLDYSYRYLHAQQTGHNELSAMDAFNRRHIARYLANIEAMEKLVAIQDEIATLKKHQAINDPVRQSDHQRRGAGHAGRRLRADHLPGRTAGGDRLEY